MGAVASGDRLSWDYSSLFFHLAIEKKQTKLNERDRETERIAKKKGDKATVKKMQSRIATRTATAKKKATSKKVKALEVLQAELEVEVKALKARKAVMPGSAVSYS